MNCKNCGAILTLHPTNGHWQCTYCQTQQVAEGEPQSLDNIVASDAKSEIFCPCCMDEHQLQFGMLDKIHIAFCPDCFGYLIDSQSMGYVLKNRRKEYSGIEDEPAPPNPDDLSKSRNCPRCQSHMETHPYYGPGNAVIDSCSRCKMVWMDNGDLAQLVRAPGLR